MRELLRPALADSAARTARGGGVKWARDHLPRTRTPGGWGRDLALRPYDSHVLVIATGKSALFYAAVVRCLILELPFCCIDEDTPPGRISDICGQLKNPLIWEASTIRAYSGT